MVRQNKGKNNTVRQNNITNTTVDQKSSTNKMVRQNKGKTKTVRQNITNTTVCQNNSISTKVMQNNGKNNTVRQNITNTTVGQNSSTNSMGDWTTVKTARTTRMTTLFWRETRCFRRRDITYCSLNVIRREVILMFKDSDGKRDDGVNIANKFIIIWYTGILIGLINTWWSA